MTAMDLLQRLLDGHAVPTGLLTEELARMAMLAVLLASDPHRGSVAMRPRARAELSERLLQAALRTPHPIW